MIITRTPLRISLAGGGTDMPAFYSKAMGAVVSFGIDKYMYISVNKKFDGKTRVSYSRTENVLHPMELRHDLAREALLHFNTQGVEITSVADIPGNGTGLGSSSAFTVGLVRALCASNYGAQTRPIGNVHPNYYAEEAYHIERERCQHPVGKQDHYAAAYGGVHFYTFKPREVTAEMLLLDDDVIAELENRLVLLWTGKNRSAPDILKRQEANLESATFEAAKGLVDLAVQLRDDLRQGTVDNIGTYLHENWKIKRKLATGITSSWIDIAYDKAMDAGAVGGKILGAGGGGLFLFFGKHGIRRDLEEATGLRAVPFKIDHEGSKVIYENAIPG